MGGLAPGTFGLLDHAFCETLKHQARLREVSELSPVMQGIMIYILFNILNIPLKSLSISFA